MNGFYVASFYGVSGPKTVFEQSEQVRLLQLAFSACGALGNAPVFLCLDSNVNLDAHALFQLLNVGSKWTDLAAAYRGDGVNQATYCKRGVHPGMEVGDGATRIDSIFSNHCGTPLVTDFVFRFDLGVPSHIGLQVTLSTKRLGCTGIFFDKPTPPLPSHSSRG